jgi:hypothetical protein
MKKVNTFGAEIEKPIIDLKTGNSVAVSQTFFKRLKNAADKRNTKNSFHFSDIKPGTIVGVVSEDLGEQGLDNGFNLLESAISYQTSLNDLNKKILLDLKTEQDNLLKENLSIINLSIHPSGKRDLKTYKKLVAPRGVYPYILFRGWNHPTGINAKAQNSPSTGVSVKNAAKAVTAIIGAGAAFIGIFANSPFEDGKRSKYKESRLAIWEEMMKTSKVEGDRITSTFPKKPFKNLAQYFNWMFGGKTGIHFVMAEKQKGKADYKGIGDRILIIDDNPSVLKYLSKNMWNGRFLKDIQKGQNKTVSVKPNISHMEAMQFAQFIGARIRYGLKQENFPIQDFVDACKKINETKVEDIFEKYTNFVYIEGRDAGANFPDEQINSFGEKISQSVVISPSAMQSGLINNLDKVLSYLNTISWSDLGKLRNEAIQNGLQGKIQKITVEEFAKRVLNLALEGLEKKEHWMLEYPKWVLETKQNGADRALAFVKNNKNNLHNAIVKLIKQRQVII